MAELMVCTDERHNPVCPQPCRACAEECEPRARRPATKQERAAFSLDGFSPSRVPPALRRRAART